MIEITKVFQNTDEINAYLFKDTTPFAYCKAVVEDMIAEQVLLSNKPADAAGFVQNRLTFPLILRYNIKSMRKSGCHWQKEPQNEESVT